MVTVECRNLFGMARKSTPAVDISLTTILARVELSISCPFTPTNIRSCPWVLMPIMHLAVM